MEKPVTNYDIIIRFNKQLPHTIKDPLPVSEILLYCYCYRSVNLVHLLCLVHHLVFPFC